MGSTLVLPDCREGKNVILRRNRCSGSLARLVSSPERGSSSLPDPVQLPLKGKDDPGNGICSRFEVSLNLK